MERIKETFTGTRALRNWLIVGLITAGILVPLLLVTSTSAVGGNIFMPQLRFTTFDATTYSEGTDLLVTKPTKWVDAISGGTQVMVQGVNGTGTPLAAFITGNPGMASHNFSTDAIDGNTAWISFYAVSTGMVMVEFEKRIGDSYYYGVPKVTIMATRIDVENWLGTSLSIKTLYDVSVPGTKKILPGHLVEISMTSINSTHATIGLSYEGTTNSITVGKISYAKPTMNVIRIMEFNMASFRVQKIQTSWFQ